MIKDRRLRKKAKIRKKINGNREIPRLTVYKSLRSFYVQAIDDENSQTLCAAMVRGKKNREAASELATIISSKLKEKSISKGKFDRNGYKFGVVMRSFVEELRKHSIEI